MARFEPRDNGIGKQNATYAVLGGPSWGMYKYETWPKTPVQLNNPYPCFPINFMCANDREAASILRLQEEVNRIEQLPIRDIVDRLEQDPALDKAFQTPYRSKFYVVVNGVSRTTTIFLTWADTHEEIGGLPKVVYKKFEVLIEAIEFALRRGWRFTEKKIAEFESDDELADKIRAVSISRSGSQASSPATGRTYQQNSGPANPQRSPVARGGLFGSPDGSPSRAPTRNIFSFSTSSTPSVASSQLTEFPKGTLNVRETSGKIIGTGKFSTTMFTVASFGERLDSFLDCFGYQLLTIDQLAVAWKGSATYETFAGKMAEFQMGRSEALWFWNEIIAGGGKVGERQRPRIVAP